MSAGKVWSCADRVRGASSPAEVVERAHILALLAEERAAIGERLRIRRVHFDRQLVVALRLLQLAEVPEAVATIRDGRRVRLVDLERVRVALQRLIDLRPGDGVRWGRW